MKLKSPENRQSRCFSARFTFHTDCEERCGDDEKHQPDNNKRGEKNILPKRNTIGKWTDEDLLDCTPEVRLRNLIFSVILFILVVSLWLLMLASCCLNECEERRESGSVSFASLEHRRYFLHVAVDAGWDVHFMPASFFCVPRFSIIFCSLHSTFGRPFKWQIFEAC